MIAHARRNDRFPMIGRSSHSIDENKRRHIFYGRWEVQIEQRVFAIDLIFGHLASLKA